jgi:hypothetical protein
MTRPLAFSALSGLAWGAIGSLLFWRHAGNPKPFYFFAIPFGCVIGILIYFVFRPFYRKSSKWLFPVSIVSTYLAVFLFGLVLGLADLAFNDTANRIAYAVILQAAIACLWGVTFFPIYCSFLS